MLRGWTLRVTWQSATEVLVGGRLVLEGEDVADALATRRAAGAGRSGEVWCQQHCHPGLVHDCRQRARDGEAQTCDVGEEADDGAPCGHGRGTCAAGARRVRDAP